MIENVFFKLDIGKSNSILSSLLRIMIKTIWKRANAVIVVKLTLKPLSR